MKKTTANFLLHKETWVYRSLFLGCAFCSSAIFANQGSEALSLQQAINYALSQNRDLIQSGFDVQTRQIGIIGAKSEFQISVIPQININSSATTSESTKYTLNANKKFITGTKISTRVIRSDESLTTEPSNHFRTSIELEIQQPLFRNAGELINGERLVRANISYHNELRRVELKKADLIINVVTNFEDVFRLARQVEANERVKQRTDELFRLTKIREILGRADKIDTLSVEFIRDQTLSRLEKDRESLASLKQDFADLLGFQPDKTFELKPTELIEFKLKSAKEAIETALHNRLDYAEIIQNYKDSIRGISISRKQALPALNLTTRYTRYFDDPDALAGVGLEENVWFAGLTASTDLNRSNSQLNIRQAILTRDRQLQNIITIELSIKRQVSQHILAYQRARKDVDILERTFSNARKRLKLASRMYELGRGTSITVTDAEDALFIAETQLLASHAEASVRGYQLSRVLGTLIASPDALKPTSIGPY